MSELKEFLLTYENKRTQGSLERTFYNSIQKAQGVLAFTVQTFFSLWTVKETGTENYIATFQKVW